MAMDRIQTGAKALDIMTDGGLSTGTITQIFGEKALGKSILSLQAAYSTVAAGSSAVILDTEQSYFSYLVEYRRPGFEKRFGDKVQVKELRLERITRSSKKKDQPASRSELVTALSATLDRIGVAYNDNHMSAIADVLSPDFTVNLDGSEEPSIFIVQMPEIIDLLALHGNDVQKIVSEGGRVEAEAQVHPRLPVGPSPDCGGDQSEASGLRLPLRALQVGVPRDAGPPREERGDGDTACPRPEALRRVRHRGRRDEPRVDKPDGRLG